MNDDVLRTAYAHVLAARAPNSRRECPTPEALLAVVKHRGSEAERHATLDHVSRCFECRRDLDLLRAVQATRVPVARRLSTLAAAAAILVLGVPLISYYMLRPAAPHPEPERAAGDVSLVSPRGDMRAVQPIGFVWRRVESADQYDVTVVGDDGSTIARETTRDTSVLVHAALSGGRDYYWSVVAHLANGGERRSEPLRFRFTTP